MAELHLIQRTQVTLTASFDSSGELELSYGDQPLSRYDDNLHLQSETFPVGAEIADFVDADGKRWTVSVEHEAADDSTVTWKRDDERSRSHFAWPETAQFHAVTATATNGSRAQKTKLVFIKVRPYPDAPDL